MIWLYLSHVYWLIRNQCKTLQIKNMLLSLHIPYNQYYINSLETFTIACIVLYRTYWFSLIYTEISSNCIAKREIFKSD